MIPESIRSRGDVPWWLNVLVAFDQFCGALLATTPTSPSAPA